MNRSISTSIRFPVKRVLVDFDDLGFERMDEWEDISEFVLGVSGSKEKEGESLGGASSDIIDITIDNSGNEFSKDNINSPYYGKIKNNIRFVLKAGVNGEELTNYSIGYIQSFSPRWKGNELIIKGTCPMTKLKKADTPKRSFKNVTWDRLIHILLDHSGIDRFFIREIPRTEFFFRYFVFEEEKCFDALKKLLEIAVGQAYFEGNKFKVRSKLTLEEYRYDREVHNFTVDDIFEFEETVGTEGIINKIELKSEHKTIAPLQVVWGTPENFTNVDNEQTFYSGDGYIYVDNRNLPIYFEEGSHDIIIENLSNGSQIEWDTYNAELGRIKISETSMSNVSEGDLISVSYTYQLLVLMPNSERKFLCSFEEDVDALVEPDVVAWNADASDRVPYSKDPDVPGTVSRQYLNILDDRRTAHLILKNNTNEKVSISTLQFRGFPIKVLNPIEVYNKDEESIKKYDVHEISIQNNYINNSKLAEKISQYIIDNNSTPKKRLSINIEGYSQLSLDDIMKVMENKSGTNHELDINRMDFNFSVDNGWTATLDLEETEKKEWQYEEFEGDSSEFILPKLPDLFEIEDNVNDALYKIVDLERTGREYTDEETRKLRESVELELLKKIDRMIYEADKNVLETEISKTNEELALRAKKSEVYTREEVDDSLIGLSGRISNAEAELTVHADEIATRVTKEELEITTNPLIQRLTAAESSIKQNYDSIQHKVEKITFDNQVNTLNSRIDHASSLINQQAEQIALKVSRTDYNGEVISSLINQTASDIKIEASKLDLSGYVTFSKFDGTTKRKETEVTEKTGVPSSALPPTFKRPTERSYKGWDYEVDEPVFDDNGILIQHTEGESMDIPTTDVLNAEEGTIEISFTPLTLGGNQHVIRMDFPNGGRFLLFVSTTNRLTFSIDEWGGGSVNTDVDFVQAGRKYDVVVKWSKKSMTYNMYINGEHVGVQTYEDMGDFPGTLQLSPTCDSIVHDIRFSKVARTDEELGLEGGVV